MRVFKIIIRIVLILVLAVVVFVGGFIVYSAITELHPKDVEEMTIDNNQKYDINKEDTIKLMTWNVGYCALGDNEDFFMDGGQNVNAKDKDRVLENFNNISNRIISENPDLVMLQEIDIKSKRSFKINEQEMMVEKLGKDNYASSFAYNYKSGYIPYPVKDMLGHMEAGLLTFSKYEMQSSTRIQLPVPFSWPVSMFNLKRCLLINRFKIKGSDKELVLINLHLEAYDSGEGKIAQTNMLKEYIDKENEKGNYVIAGGDFNQTFSNIDKNKYPAIDPNGWLPGAIEASTFSDYNLLMDTSYPTCRSLIKPYKGEDKSKFQFYMIDGFIVSKNINVVSLNTLNLDFVSSDHNPVVLEFKVN